MRIYLVGGTFDAESGKSSGVISKMAKSLSEHEEVSSLRTFNGGNVETLIELYNEGVMEDGDTIIWFPNVPNTFEKNRDIKRKYPKKLLVTSKRNHGEYEFNYLVNHALGMKANLTIEFSRGEEGKFQSMLFDPLGAVWVDKTHDLGEVVEGLVKRLSYLKSVKRVGTFKGNGDVEIPSEREFIDVVKSLSDTFHELIHPAEGVNRFLGNASFRCRHGFPSFKKDGKIYVTRRNIDKRDLGVEGFVPVERGKQNEIVYYGDHKPSVDTPIQLALYEHYEDVQYMAHSHIYIEGAPFTKKAVPCGGLQEVDEIVNLFPDKDSVNFAVNLIGHGSLILSDSVEDIKRKSKKYVARPMPEVL